MPPLPDWHWSIKLKRLAVYWTILSELELPGLVKLARRSRKSHQSGFLIYCGSEQFGSDICPPQSAIIASA